MKLDIARIRDDQASCWNCPCTLGQLLPAAGMVEQAWTIGTQPIYRREADDPRFPGFTILSIPKRARDRLKRTEMPMQSRRRQTLTKDGRFLASAVTSRSGFWPLPVLMPCWRPGCGQPNRVDIPITEGLGLASSSG